jgi:hypothetical protein
MSKRERRVREKGERGRMKSKEERREGDVG